MANIYNYPKYYEIAFAFRNIEKEVNVFEECCRKYSTIQLKTFLEIGCGNSPHMKEILNRGYAYRGIDLNERMIKYSLKKVTHTDNVKIYKANMVDFKINDVAQFAFINLGSLYVKTTTEIVSHFKSIGHCLSKGGLYFLDSCVRYYSLSESIDHWVMKKNGITVETTYTPMAIDPFEQTVLEKIELKVNENGKKKVITTNEIKRDIYPQEFLRIIEHETPFEFVGWWNNWNLLDPIPTKNRINRPIIVVRKR